jgi:hypothetical protein
MCTIGQSRSIFGTHKDLAMGAHGIPNMRMPRTVGIDLLENYLLRRLDGADFARIARDLVEVEIDRDHVLYNPGDPVETVYFPCGASVASFVLSLDDGREVDTLAIGHACGIL